ncbi:MAG: DNA polymerase III subunit delta [bacterium]
MRWYEFLNSVKTRVDPVYIFMGVEDSLKTKGENLVSKNFGADNRIRMDSLNSAAEILGELNSEFLFSKKKVVTVKDAELFKVADLKSLLGYERNPNTVLVFFSKWKPEIKNLFQKNKISPVDCFTPFPDALAREIRSSVKAAGKNIEEDAIRELLSISRNSSEAIDSNLVKILSFLGDEKTITKETVGKAGDENELLNIFEFFKELLQGRSENVLRRCERTDKSDYFPYLGFLTKRFETMLMLKEIQKDAKTLGDETLKKFKIIKKDMPYIRTFLYGTTTETLVKCYKIILETYENIKKGQENAFTNAALKILRVLEEGGHT